MERNIKLPHKAHQFLRRQNISEFPPVYCQQALSWFQDQSIQWRGIQQLVCMKDPLLEPSDMTVPEQKNKICILFQNLFNKQSTI